VTGLPQICNGSGFVMAVELLGEVAANCCAFDGPTEMVRLRYNGNMSVDFCIPDILFTADHIELYSQILTILSDMGQVYVT
jgi:hypothetical protein